MVYFYLGDFDYVYIDLNKHSGILVYALILKDPTFYYKPLVTLQYATLTFRIGSKWG